MLRTCLVAFCLFLHAVQALPQDVQCTITATEPTTCYITTPIFLMPLSTLNIVSTPELVNVTRFELKAFTNLIRIPPIIWSVFPNLQEVIMADYASVDAISIADFMYASQLKVLNLRGNKLTTVPYSTFALAKSLEELNLSQNLIAEIEDMAFNGLDQLKQLDLSNNRVGLLTTFTFAGLANLEVLDLSHNKIKLCDGGVFNLPNLKILNVNTNDLKLLPESLFGASVQVSPLEVVDFGENKLTHIGTSFYNLMALNLLNLTSNKKIDDINLAALAQLPNLETLLLSNSGFRFPVTYTMTSATILTPDIPTTVPTSISPLKKLYLAKNKIANPDVFRQLAYFRHLEVLSLEENSLTLLSDVASVPTWFPNLHTIYIGENKLNCDWLNETIPLFQANDIHVFTVKKTKTWYGTTIYEKKLIDLDDCFDFEKIYDKIMFFLTKFGKTAL